MINAQKKDKLFLTKTLECCIMYVSKHKEIKKVMATSGLELINAKTGEVVEDIIFRLNGELYDPEDTGFKGTFNFKNNEAKKQNIRIYRINDEEQIDDIDVNIEYDCENTNSLKERYKFTKIYQEEDPMFSKDSYYKYWVKICCSLKKDTNVIYNRKPNLHKVDQISNFETLCEGSRSNISKFMQVCFAKGFIAEFKLKGKKEFVVNPKYVLNGKKMPVLLYNLFNEDDVSDGLGNDNRDTNE
ncbi:hypothetical protein LCGC14_1823680 [marine sediment metagenome]|uniref:Uncharacterized protein n=1 Tax=marine sediment metagenome TaxID=412755 RepID=A0A0F9JHM1_9ZZZZ